MRRKKKTASEPGTTIHSMIINADSIEKAAKTLAATKPFKQSIEIKKGKLKDSLFCHYIYDHTVSANTTNKVRVESGIPAHEDLKNAFKKLDVHLAVICEEVIPADIPNIDELPVRDPDLDDDHQDSLYTRLSKFSVIGFEITGTGENEGVILTGYKELSTREYVKLETPIVKYEDEYAFTNELRIAVDDLVKEIIEYMNGKRAPELKQQELDFDYPPEGEDPLQDIRELHKAAMAGEED